MALTLWPVRCYTCNYLISKHRDAFEDLLRTPITVEMATEVLISNHQDEYDSLGDNAAKILIAKYQDEFNQISKQNTPRDKAMDMLGLTTDCCRKTVMVPPKYPMGYDVPILDAAELRQELRARPAFKAAATQAAVLAMPLAKPLAKTSERVVRTYTAI